MLMRSMGRREKTLLLVLVLLILAGLYMLLVHQPVERSMAKLAVEKEDAELRLEVAQIRLQKYGEMKAELEDIFAMPKDELTVMPPYDNAEALMVQLNNIFGELEYDLSFSEVVFNESVATRAVQFTFEAPSYEEARVIIDKLTHTGNRSLMNTLSIVPAEQSRNSRDGIRLRTTATGQAGETGGGIRAGAQTVSGTITFYELAPQTAAAAPSAAPSEG